MLAEARQALLMHRLIHGAAALNVADTLRMATSKAPAAWAGTTSEPWKPASAGDVALFDLRDCGYRRAGDAVSALLLWPPPA